MLSLAVISLLCIAALILRTIINGLRSPLSQVPGPWHTRFKGTALWLATVQGRRIHHVHALHQQYGPIVRLSPNECSVAESNAVTQIHRIGGNFTKSPWYESTHRGREPGLFAMQDPHRHAQRRRLFARAFSHTNLMTSWEGTVRAKVSLAVRRIKESALRAERGRHPAGKHLDDTYGADVMKWWTLMATDVIAHLAFGESFRMLDQGKQTPYIDAVQQTLLGSVIRNELPFIWPILKMLPFKSLRTFTSAEATVMQHGELAIQNMRREGSGSQNLFGQMEAAAEKDDGKITDDDVKGEAGNLIVAGSDTTAVTLTYLVWSVLKQPDLQRDLEDEISRLNDGLEMGELINNAPLLNSVIEETLRLYGAAPGALPRTVPSGGAHLAGYDFAPGVEVSTQAYTLHRDGAAWPDPLRFDGRRFLDKANLTPVQKALLQPFGGGSRVCIGIHLAWMEMRLGAAMFFRKCRGARLADCMTDDMMEMDNRFLIAPKGHCCYVVL